MHTSVTVMDRLAVGLVPEVDLQMVGSEGLSWKPSTHTQWKLPCVLMQCCVQGYVVEHSSTSTHVFPSSFSLKPGWHLHWRKEHTRKVSIGLCQCEGYLFILWSQWFDCIYMKEPSKEQKHASLASDTLFADWYIYFLYKCFLFCRLHCFTIVSYPNFDNTLV